MKRSITNTELNLEMLARQLMESWLNGNKSVVADNIKRFSTPTAMYLAATVSMILPQEHKHVFCNFLQDIAVEKIGPQFLSQVN